MAESQARLIVFVERMPSPPLVEQFRSMSWITDRLAGIPQRKTPLWWWRAIAIVFWIGIGHAGTLISAILYLCRRKWRTAINRSAEAMTLFAVMCAAIFPGIHVGRVWMAWFLIPVPVPNWIWPNFRSPLMWDVFAVSTYFTVSVL